MKFIKKTLLIIALIVSFKTYSNTISGIVTDTKNSPLAFASILIKGTAKGTTANAQGKFVLTVEPGKYKIVCQFIGYQSIEKEVKIEKQNIEVEFILQELQFNLQDVVVKSGGEDPAYAIVRKAIEKREEYLDEIKKFDCEVYLKGQIQLRNYPKKFFGENVDFEDGDTSKRKVIFLSETLAKYSVNGKNERKIEVLSTRVSGQSDGFGFSSPQIISFYNNIVNLGRGLNPRGFVSPISNNALSYYKYKFEGTFFENGKMINRIKVIPKRTYEPLFTGTINIIEDEWRLQSVQLTCLKAQQMQFLDTLQVEQLYVPLNNVWVIKQQVIKPAGKFFGFDFFGGFVQVYDKFNIEPQFSKKFFNETYLKFLDSSNKKSKNYWDAIRPIPLSDLEARDYVKKDSIEQVRKDPKYLDSIDKRNNKITLTKLLIFGQNFNNEKKKSGISIDPLLFSATNFNTVEGLVSSLNITYYKRWEGRKRFSITPNLRYGFSNQHFNASINANYTYGKKYLNQIQVAGGKNVFQFDNNNPITSTNNTLSTLNYTRNHMKVYEAWFAKINYSKGLGAGLTLDIGANYQNRIPLENTTDYKWKTIDNRAYTPNYPINLVGATNIQRHQALSIGATLIWRPGARYIEFPDRKINIGSKYPTLTLNLSQGINSVLGSDVDYTKWQFGISDNLNLKLGGRLSYNIKIGGFLNSNKVFIPDYNHFLGNETVLATPYLNSFQLMPFYSFSNTNKFYRAGHIEYHLNGLLTNKIPWFKKLNWFLVLGANTLNIDDSNKAYYEGFISLENVFKIFRIDFIRSFPKNTASQTGIRFSTPLIN